MHQLIVAEANFKSYMKCLYGDNYLLLGRGKFEGLASLFLFFSERD